MYNEKSFPWGGKGGVKQGYMITHKIINPGRHDPLCITQIDSTKGAVLIF